MEADEGNRRKSLPSKCKASWGPQFQRIFVDLCVEQIYAGNKPKTHFTRDGWRNIVDSFRDQTGCCYDKKQLKNHWDVMKKQWKIWSKLIADGAMKWNPHNHKFGASQEDWETYLKDHPEASPFRFKELELADKMDVIFEGIDFREEYESPPGRKRQAEASSVAHFTKSQDHQVGKIPRLDNTLLSCRQARGARHDKRVDGVLDVESRSAVTVQSVRSGSNSYSIGECIECLDGMEEMEPGGELYLFALDLFLKKEYREIFLQLKNPTIKLAWLTRQQSLRPI
uniref:Myb/SANT-like domain-containing protein n=1 Tax=Kalanchoe fedtschenkoi TaxID=63787 RepID=A0A7N0UBM5_KALFE